MINILSVNNDRKGKIELAYMVDNQIVIENNVD